MWRVDLDFKETPLLRHRPHLPFWRTIMLFKLKWKSWEENWKCYKLKWLRNEKGNSLIIKSDAKNKLLMSRTRWELNGNSMGTLWDSMGTRWGLDGDSMRTRWELIENLMRTLAKMKFIFVSDFITFMYILQRICLESKYWNCYNGFPT